MNQELWEIRIRYNENFELFMSGKIPKEEFTKKEQELTKRGNYLRNKHGVSDE